MKKTLDHYYSYSMIVPVMILFFVLTIVPTIASIFFSFTYWDIFSTKWIGLQNYEVILTNPDMSIAFKNTFIFTIIVTVFKTGLGMILAVFLNQRLRTRNFLRAVYFTPAVLNNVAVGLIFTAILRPDRGFLNRFLQMIGLGFMSQDWLTNPHLAIYSIAGIEIWKWTGFTMVILLGGLQSISADYYEAADIDGASGFQKFRSITLPLILPAFNNALIMNIIGGLRVFDIIWAVTGGGPGSATETFSTLFFRQFTSGKYGLASASGLMLGLFVAVISLFSYNAIRKKEIEL
jgi:raffinose/stachyose/melibiose transport system permease protein